MQGQKRTSKMSNGSQKKRKLEHRWAPCVVGNTFDKKKSKLLGSISSVSDEFKVADHGNSPCGLRSCDF